jgi:hypothetical protein
VQAEPDGGIIVTTGCVHDDGNPVRVRGAEAFHADGFRVDVYDTGAVCKFFQHRGGDEEAD